MNSFVRETYCPENKNVEILDFSEGDIFMVSGRLRRVLEVFFYVFSAQLRKANHGAKHSSLSCAQSGPSGFGYVPAQIWSGDSISDSFLEYHLNLNWLMQNLFFS